MDEDLAINAAVLQSSLNLKEALNLSSENQFLESEGQVVTPVGYVYKVWNLGRGRRICIRCTVHNYVNKDKMMLGEQEEEKKKGENEEEDYTYVTGSKTRYYQNVYALNEFENNKTNWKKTLDQNMAQCLSQYV